MDADAFWKLIDRMHRASPDDVGGKCLHLEKALRKLNDSDLRDFLAHFDDANARAYDRKLWAAAYVLNGGCSDDAFSDFRASLISCGRTTFESALTDPDSLADLEPGYDLFFEGFQYVAPEVATTRWGSVPPRSKPFPSCPSGEDWKEEDLPRLLPRLSGSDQEPTDVKDTPATAEAGAASFAEWKNTPIPAEQKLDALLFAMVWTSPEGRAQFETMRREAGNQSWNNPELKSALKQIQRSASRDAEGHERLLDDALRARGFITLTEIQAHDEKHLAEILAKRTVASFFQFDLAQRVLASTIPLSDDERATLTTATAAYKPRQNPLLEALDDEDAE